MTHGSQFKPWCEQKEYLVDRVDIPDAIRREREELDLQVIS